MNQGESKAEIPFKQGELFNPEDYAGDLLLTQEQFNAISRLEDKGCFIAERLKRGFPKHTSLLWHAAALELAYGKRWRFAKWATR